MNNLYVRQSKNIFLFFLQRIGRLILLCTALLVLNAVKAQTQPSPVRQMQEAAKALVQQGEYEKAIRVLELANEQSPNDVEILKDLSFAAYLNRDFTKAMFVGKKAIQQADADPQAFQLLGLTYKALAMYKDCQKLYTAALKKFPNSGVLYNEYAELLAINKQMDEAITQWEKGIQSDPGFSSNYYNAAMYYMRTNSWLKVMLYGEIFVNIESYTDRTTEVKGLLYNATINLMNRNTLQLFLSKKGTSAFEQLILSDILKVFGTQTGVITIDSLMAIRSRFVVEWIKNQGPQFPYRLFDHQQYLIQHQLFDAYNQWLLMAVANPAAYQDWLNNHVAEKEAWQTFQQSRVFKLPVGQYYF
jgi:tetratricopeptide (TPR) repeat protein